MSSLPSALAACHNVYAQCLFDSFSRFLITHRGVSSVLMLGGVQSLAESKIGRFRVEEGVRLVGVIQGAATERHH